MEKITLASIKAWMDAQLDATAVASEWRQIVARSRLEAFYLGALDKYAALTKESQTEFWTVQKQYGYEYKVGRLPERGSPRADDFVSLGHAYSQGEYEGEAAAEEYNTDTLPNMAYSWDIDAAEMKIDKMWMKMDVGKKEYARTKRIADELWRRYYSDECGWGENWWED